MLKALEIEVKRGAEEKRLTVTLDKLLSIKLRGTIPGEDGVFGFSSDIMYGGLNFAAKGNAKVLGRPDKSIELIITMEGEQILTLKAKANLLGTSKELSLIHI